MYASVNTSILLLNALVFLIPISIILSYNKKNINVLSGQLKCVSCYNINELNIWFSLTEMKPDGQFFRNVHLVFNMS